MAYWELLMVVLLLVRDWERRGEEENRRSEKERRMKTLWETIFPPSFSVVSLILSTSLHSMQLVQIFMKGTVFVAMFVLNVWNLVLDRGAINKYYIEELEAGPHCSVGKMCRVRESLGIICSSCGNESVKKCSWTCELIEPCLVGCGTVCVCVCVCVYVCVYVCDHAD